jgi:hypothetical protein
MATQSVDNVDNQKQIAHMIHMAILLCASAGFAWTICGQGGQCGRPF